MRDVLAGLLRDFFSSEEATLKEGVPVILGFSGGGDSSALLSLLSQCDFLQINLCVAHFDHAWRVESAEEALLLKNKVESMGIPFYSERSSFGASLSNKEEEARKERYSFFKKIYFSLGAQALLLAHQGEDQAETVLKRIFEGAGVFSCAGMLPCSYYEGMRILRPLLSVSRKVLIDWNRRNRISYLQDSTNSDLQFLRPRMREKLFPEIEKWFGKNVQKNLVAISREIAFLKASMEKRLLSLLAKKTEGALGFYLPISDLCLEDPLDRSELVRLLLKEKGISIGRRVLSLIDMLILKGASNKRVDVEKGFIIIDKGQFFWFVNPLPRFEFNEFFLNDALVLKSFDWVWEIQKTPQKLSSYSFWISFLSGEVFYRIPLNISSFALVSYDCLSASDQKKISGFFSKNKIPAAIKFVIPFLVSDEVLIDLNLFFCFDLVNSFGCEFLSIKLKKC